MYCLLLFIRKNGMLQLCFMNPHLVCNQHLILPNKDWNLSIVWKCWTQEPIDSDHVPIYDPTSDVPIYDPTSDVSKYDLNSDVPIYDPISVVSIYDPNSDVPIFDPNSGGSKYYLISDMPIYDPTSDVPIYDPTSDVRIYDPTSDVPICDPTSGMNLTSVFHVCIELQLGHLWFMDTSVLLWYIYLLYWRQFRVVIQWSQQW